MSSRSMGVTKVRWSRWMISWVRVQRLRACFEGDWEAAELYHAPDPLEPHLHDAGELPPDPHFVHD